MTYWGENVAFRDSYPGALVLMRHFERYLGLTDTEASKLLESMSGSDTISVVA